MTINRYTAATMQQALARVKAALGPEAVILETASAPGEVTVTAAVDRMPAPRSSGGASGRGSGGSSCRSSTRWWRKAWTA